MGSYIALDRIAKCSAMTANSTILMFPHSTGSARRRVLRKALLNALRVSEGPIIVDLSSSRALDHEDITLLLDCVSLTVGRDTQLLLIAGSCDIQILLDVTRISSLVPVFTTLKEALEFKPQYRPASHICGAPDFKNAGVVQ